MSKVNDKADSIGEGRVSIGPLEDASENAFAALKNSVTDFVLEDAPEQREDMVLPDTGPVRQANGGTELVEPNNNAPQERPSENKGSVESKGEAAAVAENSSEGTVVATLVVDEPDAEDTFSFEIKDGSSQFVIVGNEVRVRADAQIDYEDAKSFDLVIEVTDSAGNTQTKKLTIDVEDINEDPVDILLSGDTVAENSSEGTVVAKLTTDDPDAGDTFSYAIKGGSTQFEVVGDEIRVKAGAQIDYEDTKSHDLTVEVTDSAGNTYSEQVTVNVVNVNEGPVDILVKGGAVAENSSEGTVVAKLATDDPDSGDTFSYSIKSGSSQFEIVGNEVRVKTGAQINYEDAKSHDLTIEVTDAGGNTYSEQVTVKVENVNEGPTEILMKGGTVAENSSEGTVVAKLATVDPDAGDTFSYSIKGGSSQFEIVGDEVRVKAGAKIDYEDTKSLDLTIEVTDAGGNTYSEQVTVKVENVNEGPTEILMKGGTVAENSSEGTVVAKLATVDPDAGDTFSYSIKGGSSQFEIVGDEVRVKAGAKIDYEDTKSHDLAVEVTDAGGNTYSEQVTVNVVNLNEGPVDILVKGGAVAENSSEGTVVAKLATDDPDSGDTFSYSIKGGSSQFEIVGNEVRVKTGAQINYEDAKSHDLTIEVTDAGGNTYSEQVTVKVENVNEGPTEILMKGGTVAENSSEGTVVAKLATVDPDAGDTFSYSIKGGSSQFEIVGDEVRVKAGAKIDYEDTKSHDLTIEVTDSAGNTHSEKLTINIQDVVEVNEMLGTENADVLRGTAQNDAIKGLAGNDYLAGNDGDDHLDGGAGNDRLIGGAGADELRGGDGNDLLYVDAEDTVVDGGAGSDRVIVQGKDGIELDMAKSSIERVDGGVGDDKIDASGATTAATILGNGGDDKIAGGEANDYLHGGDGNDNIEGGAGNDRLIGAAGADELRGGDGNDLLYADAEDTVVEGGDGYDRVIVQGKDGIELDMAKSSIERVDGGVGDDKIDASGAKTAATILGNAGDDKIAGGSANDYLNGGADNDSIDGGAGNDRLIGGTGADELRAGDGNDLLYADAEDTVVDGGAGYDRVIVQGEDGIKLDMAKSSIERADGGVGDDSLDASGSTTAATILGNGGDDKIAGGEANDYLNGGADNDSIDGGAGNDRLIGGTGADELRAGDGNDLLYADAEDTVVDGGAGYDRVIVQGEDGIKLDMAKSSIERADGGVGDDSLDASGSTTAATILGNGGDDKIAGGEANDYLHGGDGNDSIDGGAGNDRLIGGAGADEMRGGEGNDLLYADADDTVVDGGDGYDRVIVQGEEGIKLDMTSSSIERADGGVGNDSLDASGSTEAATILGNGGDDKIAGGDANDYLHGGDGNDTVKGGAGNDRVYGGDGNDALSGGEGNDYLYGGDGNDSMEGGAGNDYLIGGAGADEMRGGEGDDLLYADADDTVVDGGAGYDRVIVQGENGIKLDMTSSSIERVDGGVGDDTLDASGSTTAATILGNGGDDKIAGGDANDYLHGGDGNDTVKGGAGNDRVYGAAGNDTLSGGEGNDYLYGGDGNDSMEGGAGNDYLIGGAGADEMRGGEGDDLLYADADDTVVDGGAGYDRVIVQGEEGIELDMTSSSIERVDGGVGNDALDASGSTTATTVLGNGGDDKITGGDANDYLHGGDGNDTVEGGGGDDRVYGGDGNDTLSGGEGNDYLYGGDGNDTLEGGAGNDRSYGGDGNDLFTFGEGGGSDYAHGGAGESWTDTVQLDGGANLGTYGTDWTVNVTQGSVTSQDANSITLSDDADGVIILQDGSEMKFQDMESIQW